MANLLYVRPSENVIANATITASAADAEYPATRLHDGNPADPAKLTTTSGNFVFAFGAAQRIDVVALIHHNLTAGLEVRIQGNASNVWTSPTFNQQITIPAYRENGFPINPFLDLTGLSGYSASGFQYWRLVIVGANAEAVAIGELVLGSVKRTLEINLSWGLLDDEDQPVVEHRTSARVSHIVSEGTAVRTLEGEVDTTDAGGASLLSLSRDSRGRARPFLVVPDPATNDALFVRFIESKLPRTWAFLDRKRVPVRLEEVSPGLPL